jgi:hypothetical protein
MKMERALFLCAFSADCEKDDWGEFSHFIQNLKTIPFGYGQRYLAMPVNRPYVNPKLSCPHNFSKGETYEPIQEVITHNMALPIPYCVGSKV